MILADLQAPDAYLALPQIEKAAVRWQWPCDFWDGPITGVVLYEGVKYWAQQCAEHVEAEPWYRRYLIIELSEEQLQDEEYWHRLFEEKVGTHTCSHLAAEARKVKREDHWREFYEPYQQRTPPDFSQNRVVGWFES